MAVRRGAQKAEETRQAAGALARMADAQPIDYATELVPVQISPIGCANCGRMIGKLETPSLWNEQVVCASCRKLLDTTPQPMHYAGRSASPPPTTIEQTSKSWKLQILLGLLTLFAGLVVAAIGIQSSGWTITLAGLLIFVFGFVWLFVAKIMAWWHHG